VDSYRSTHVAIERLIEAKILKQVNVGHRNRAFEAPEGVRTFTDLERRLARADVRAGAASSVDGRPPSRGRSRP
jgi:hypothetical protein